MNLENLGHKNYNPCGAPVGTAARACEAARTSYFNLPFAQVIRNVAIRELADAPETNAAASWADYNLSDVEKSAALDFTDLTRARIGLVKFFVHVLFENRYNIEYNRLVDYAKNLDANALAAAETNGLTFENFERKIDDIAKETRYDATFDDMTAELENFVRSFGG